MWRAFSPANPVSRLTVGWGCSVTSLMVAQIAMLVWTFQAGGAGLVALYGVATTLPAAAVTPLVTGLAGRVRGDTLLRATALARAVFTALTAGAVAVGLGAAVVVALAAAAAALSGTYRPLQAASLPWLVRTPEELSRANVRATMLENTGGLAGPALGGALVGAASPAVALAGSAALMGLGLAALIGVRTSEQPTVASGDARAGSHFFSDVLTGVRALLRVLRGGGLVVIAFAQTFTRGLLLVLTVVLALDVLGLHPDSIGWLNAMIGLGGLVGGILAGRLLRLARLARSFVLGVALWGVPLAVLGLAPSTPAAFVALFFVGFGNALEDGSMFILIPRLAGPAHAAMALGALEVVVFTGVGLGAVTAPAFVSWPGTTQVLVVAGAVLLVLAVAWTADAVRVDRTTPLPGAELALVQTSPIFAPLPLITVERLVASARREVHPDGTRVIVEGERGDRFYLIEDGTAAVTVHAGPRPAIRRGEGFGEIALLQDVPRTATVIAAGGLTTLSFAREDFLAAVSGNQASLGLARGLAGDRLARDERAAG